MKWYPHVFVAERQKEAMLLVEVICDCTMVMTLRDSIASVLLIVGHACV